MNKSIFNISNYTDDELDSIFSIKKTDTWPVIEKKIDEFKNQCLKHITNDNKLRGLLDTFITDCIKHYKPTQIQTRSIEKLLEWYETKKKQATTDKKKTKLENELKDIFNILLEHPNIISMNDETIKKELDDPSMNSVHQLESLFQSHLSRGESLNHTTHIEPYRLGNLNPLHRRINTHLLNIDTIFCNPKAKQEDNTSDFEYTLPTPLYNVISMKLSSSEIPNTFFMFDDYLKSNIFLLEIGIDCSGEYTSENQDISRVELYPITIPEGNYEAEEFVQRINEVFVDVNNSIPSNGRLNLRYLICEFISVDSRINFRFRNSFDEVDGASQYLLSSSPDDLSRCYISLNFNVQDVEFERTAGWTLGYREPYYKVHYNDPNAIITQWIDEDDVEAVIDQNDEISANSYKKIYCNLKTECIYGSNKLNYLFISVDDYVGNHNSSIVSYFPNHILDEKILGRVVFKFGSYTFNFEDLGDQVYKQRDYYGPVKIEKLRIRLLDKYGYLVNLKGSDYSLLLECKTIYS